MSDEQKPQRSKTFEEAQFSASVEMAGPNKTPAGERFKWTYTLKSDSREILAKVIPSIEQVLLKNGFIPWGEHVGQQVAARGRNPGQPSVSQQQNGGLPVPTAGSTTTTQLTKVAAGPLSDRDTTLVYKGMTGKSKHLVNIYPDSGADALQKLAALGLDPAQPSSLFARGVTEIQTPGWKCLVGLTDDGKWANKILDVYPAQNVGVSQQTAQDEQIPF